MHRRSVLATPEGAGWLEKPPGRSFRPGVTPASLETETAGGAGPTCRSGSGVAYLSRALVCRRRVIKDQRGPPAAKTNYPSVPTRGCVWPSPIPPWSVPGAIPLLSQFSQETCAHTAHREDAHYKHVSAFCQVLSHPQTQQRPALQRRPLCNRVPRSSECSRLFRYHALPKGSGMLFAVRSCGASFVRVKSWDM